MAKIDAAVEKELKGIKSDIAKINKEIKEMKTAIEKNRTAITHNAKVVADEIGGVFKKMEDVKKEQIRK